MSANSKSEYRKNMRARGHKLFTYRVRIAVPETTSKHSLYSYISVLAYFTAQLYKQLGSSSKNFKSYTFSEGYDNDKGKYLEHKIERWVKKEQPLDEKIIWITK